MSREPIETTALVLSRKESGESFYSCRILSFDVGLLTALIRKARKSTTTLPDLFETGSFLLDPGKGSDGPWFIKAYHPAIQRIAIARHYHQMEVTARLIRFLLHNLPHMPHTSEVYGIIERALDHFADLHPPEIVYLKALYLIAKEEGFAVREGWLQGLSLEKQKSALACLKFSFDSAQNPKPEIPISQATLDSLETFIASETALEFPQF